MEERVRTAHDGPVTGHDGTARALGASLSAAALAAQLAGCAGHTPAEPGIGAAVAWDELPGWSEDNHAQAWPALARTCTKAETLDAPWQDVCAAAARLPAPTDARARRFFEAHFRPHRVRGVAGRTHGLITGYYEPYLRGSLTPSERYPYPIYGTPPDLLHVDLDAVLPELANRRVRARLTEGRVVPYYSRAQIDSAQQPLRGNELLWVDDRDALFFLHVQGSGRVGLDDGRTLGVGYADHNGHPYRSIGRVLADAGEIELDAVTLFSIREWLRRHPDRAADLLNANPSYVFFRLRSDTAAGPVGTFGVGLTPERSIAIDARVIPLGVPVWLDTTLPAGDQTTYRRLTFAQDTGGAITGALRADVFWGHGERAERMAGRMKQPGRLFVLLPRDQPLP